jgi:hypothetical protein
MERATGSGYAEKRAEPVSRGPARAQNLRGQPARRSLPEFKTTGRIWEDDDDYEDD